MYQSLFTSLAGELRIPPPSRDHSYAAPATSATMGVPAHYACNDEVTVASSSCQTDLSMADIAGMETKMGGMEESLRYYEDKQRITRDNFVAHVTANDGNARYYTGMPSVTMLLGILNVVVECCGDITYWKGPSTTPRRRPMNTVNRRALSTTEEYIMTLARIKLGLDTQHLGYLFGIHATTVTRIFLTWTNILYCTLTPLLVWPDRATVAHHMPRQFRERYPNTRVIIDCTEFETKRPKNTQSQAQTYSQYKSRNTCKALVGINPNGCFTFVSKVWSGNISDRHITMRSGFLDMIEPGDEVMADRGFTIRDLLLERDARLNIPPFTRPCAQRGKGRKLSPREIHATRQIATLRIHVERSIRRLKTFRLLSGVIDGSLRKVLDNVLLIAAVISNLQGPLIKQWSGDVPINVITWVVKPRTYCHVKRKMLAFGALSCNGNQAAWEIFNTNMSFNQFKNPHCVRWFYHRLISRVSYPILVWHHCIESGPSPWALPEISNTLVRLKLACGNEYTCTGSDINSLLTGTRPSHGQRPPGTPFTAMD